MVSGWIGFVTPLPWVFTQLGAWPKGEPGVGLVGELGVTLPPISGFPGQGELGVGAVPG